MQKETGQCLRYLVEEFARNYFKHLEISAWPASLPHNAWLGPENTTRDTGTEKLGLAELCWMEQHPLFVTNGNLRVFIVCSPGSQDSWSPPGVSVSEHSQTENTQEEENFCTFCQHLHMD